MFREPAIFSELHRAPLSDSSKPATEQQDMISTLHPEDSDVMGESFRERQNRYREINGQLADLQRQEHAQRLPSRQISSDTDGESFRGRRYSPVRSCSMGIPLDGSPALSISRKDNLPVRDFRKLSFTDRSEQISPGQSEAGDAQIIPISPTGDREWEEINMDGTPYLIHRDTLDDFDDYENVENARRGKGVERWRRAVEHLDHVDSGLGDMDIPDPAPRAHPLLAGVGEHANTNLGQHTDTKDIPQGMIADLGPSEQQISAESVKFAGVERQAIAEITGQQNTEQCIDGSNPLQGKTDDLKIEPNDANGGTES